MFHLLLISSPTSVNDSGWLSQFTTSLTLFSSLMSPEGAEAPSVRWLLLLPHRSMAELDLNPGPGGRALALVPWAVLLPMCTGQLFCGPYRMHVV